MKYRLGRKQRRALLDENGKEVALFHKGQEELARYVCTLLNGFEKCPICGSTDIHAFTLSHGKCRNCKEQWTN